MRFALLPAVLLPLALASPPTLLATEPVSRVGLTTDEVRFAGTVRGRVTDQSSGQPVPGAQVIVAGTRLGAAADNNGRYVITQVPAGAQTLSVRLLGYAPKSATVTVTDNGEVTADFTIERSASQLSEVVVTATGDQRKVEIGNAVATLRADSLMISAPITSVGDMLQGRVSGLMTFANAGMTGSAPRIRIRGFNSLSQPNNPLIIIDGARVDNTTGAGSGGGTNIQSYGWTAGSMTSMNPEEIESFEIVKGPAAATLYGTDAANGVIVIRTKRGTAGAPKWNFYGEGGIIPHPTNWNDTYYAFGKNAQGQAVQCVNLARVAGQCTVDSVSIWSPIRDAVSSPLGTGNRRQVGAQVSGGAQQLRYFVGGDWERERGYLELPAAEIKRISTERGGAELPDEQIHPNYLNRTALRANASAMLGPKADLNISNSLQFQRSQIPTNTLFTDAAWGIGYKDAYDGWGSQRRPGETFSTRA
ncbi:MAG: carboxypeptidase-like regulatory domain-containing protein, partial [Cytophagaceae bacterium]|nr:carboxypeptidase-like regulatory domain-containing protein [Gemmatimonadaceae bacterium]